MTLREPADRRLLLAIMLAVAVWALLIAAAAYWRSGKALAIPIVLGTVGLFLAIWAASLWLHKEKHDSADDDDAVPRG